MAVLDLLYNTLHGLMPTSLRHKLSQTVCEQMPINFGVEITNICCADCSFCAYRYQKRKKTIIDDKIYRKAIDDYCDIGGGAVNLTPTVGEPLVDKKILEKIRYARAQKKIGDIWFYTNLIPLNNFNIDEFVTSGITELKISTCIKDRETYHKIYGVDAYPQVLDNIVNLCEANIRHGKPIHIQLYLRIPKPFDEITNGADYKRVAQYFAQEDISIKDDAYDSWSGLIKESDLPWGNKIHDNPYDMTKEPCSEMYRRINILADGDVNFCVCRDLNSELRIGNIMENHLLDIWHGPTLQAFRNKWEKKGEHPQLCTGCQLYLPVSQFYDEQGRGILKRYLKHKVS